MNHRLLILAFLAVSPAFAAYADTAPEASAVAQPTRGFNKTDPYQLRQREVIRVHQSGAVRTLTPQQRDGFAADPEALVRQLQQYVRAAAHVRSSERSADGVMYVDIVYPK